MKAINLIKLFSVFLSLSCALSLNAIAQSSIQNNSPTRTGFSKLAKTLLPSVVGVSVYNNSDSAKIMTGGNAPIATGSGFVFGTGKWVITNNHVIESGSFYKINTQNGAIYNVKLLGRDEETDIAILEIQGAILPSVKFGNSDKVDIGDWAIAIGSPFGLGNSFSVGVISGRNRDLQSGRFDNFLQTDASINHGNSGGPLFDENGYVIGVNTAIVASATNGNSVGIGFAVPTNLVTKIANDIIAYGYVIRGYSGLRARPCNPNEGAGVMITAIANGGPAQKAGLKIGDRIFQTKGINISDPRHLARIISNEKIGATLRLEGYRGKQRIFANIIITKPPSLEGMNPTGIAAPAKVFGIELRMLNPAERNKFGNSADVIIASIDPYSQANGIFKAGDLITEIAGQKITNPQQAKNLIEVQKKAKGVVFIRLKREGNLQYKLLK